MRAVAFSAATVAADKFFVVPNAPLNQAPVAAASSQYVASPYMTAPDVAYAPAYAPYSNVEYVQVEDDSSWTTNGLMAALGAAAGVAAVTYARRPALAVQGTDLEAGLDSAPSTAGTQMMMMPPKLRPRVAPRAAPPQMGANVRELRDRIGSVKNTKKITSAMKLVAAAKVRRAQEAVLRSRPFSETLERILGGLLQRVKTEGLDIPLLSNRTVKKVGLVTISGDRGLCGGYNANVIKATEKRIAELKAMDVEVELIVIGNKGGPYFKRRETPIRKQVPCGQAPTADQANEIATELLSSFYAGELDRIELMYTSFVSMISSVPTVRTLVPLLPSGMEMEGDEIFKLTSKEGGIAVEKEKMPVAAPAEFVPDMIFEQEPSQLLNAILPLYLNGQLLRTMQESVASELASRMSAMQSATDNATELQGNLEQQMNRARQAKITQELMEIIAGADSVA